MEKLREKAGLRTLRPISWTDTMSWKSHLCLEVGKVQREAMSLSTKLWGTKKCWLWWPTPQTPKATPLIWEWRDKQFYDRRGQAFPLGALKDLFFLFKANLEHLHGLLMPVIQPPVMGDSHPVTTRFFKPSNVFYHIQLQFLLKVTPGFLLRPAFHFCHFSLSTLWSPG